MLQELGWLPLERRRQIIRLVSFHRIVNGQIGWSLVPGVFRGVYRGRDDHLLKVARVGSRRDVGKFSFANRTPTSSPFQLPSGNSLPQELVEIEKKCILRVPLITTR
jgi:hypothetical protein